MNTHEREELPELPEPDGWLRIFDSNGEPIEEFSTSSKRPEAWPIEDCIPVHYRYAMRAYGRLCRAGRGDVWTDEKMIAMCESVGIRWIEPHEDPEDECCNFPGAFDLSTIEAMRELFRRLSPQAGGSDE